MRRTNRLSGGPSWAVAAIPADESAARADDANLLDQHRLLRGVRATASWAVRETIFGFALYGAAYYPCPWARDLLDERHDPVEPLDIASIATDAWPEATASRRGPPLRLVVAAPARAQSGGRRTGFASRIVRLWSLLAGSARAGA